jgi:hypothetical protein
MLCTYAGDNGCYYPRVNRPDREADHSSPSSANVCILGTTRIPPPLHTFNVVDEEQIKQL